MPTRIKNSVAPLASVMRNMIRIGNLVRKAEPVYFYVGSSLQIIMVVIPFVTAWLSAIFINKLVSHNFHSIFDPQLIWIAVGYITLPFVRDRLNDWYFYLFNQFYVRFGEYRDMLFVEKKANVDIQTHETSEFSNLSLKVRENTQRMTNYAQQTMDLLSIGTAAVISIVILARYNVFFVLALLIGLSPVLIIQLKFGNRTWGIWSSRAEIRRKYAEYNNPFNNISGIIELRVFSTKKYFKSRLHDLISLFNTELQDAEHKRFMLVLAASIVNFTAGAVCIFILMRDTVAGTLAIGTFTFLFGRIGDLRSNVYFTISAFSKLVTDNLYITDIFTFLDTPQSLKDGTKDAPTETAIIVFDNVTFAYPNQSSPVLKNISFTIKAGEKVAIVGVNGAGKTTLTKLLMRFYDPTGGSVTASGIPLSEIKMQSWYAHIGYLPQDYAKYRLPVREAIAIGDPNVALRDDRVIEAARRSGADEFITKWKRGYETPLGRDFDGEEPSVGQWQKLALARVFYKNPSLWILDEPTSSIDAVAELEIFNELEHLPKDKTVILISHRFNTVKNADKIIVIEHGAIAEMGTHDELMQKEGHYYKLFTSQKDSYGGTND